MGEGHEHNDDRPWDGKGIIAKIDDGPASRLSAQVEITVVDPPGFRFPRKGGVLKSSPLYLAATDALGTGQLVYFKIVKNERGFRDLVNCDPVSASSGGSDQSVSDQSPPLASSAASPSEPHAGAAPATFVNKRVPTVDKIADAITSAHGRGWTVVAVVPDGDAWEVLARRAAS